jgi:hypothetical protein
MFLHNKRDDKRFWSEWCVTILWIFFVIRTYASFVRQGFTFGRFRKNAESDYELHVCPSVCLHGKTRLPLEHCHEILYFNTFRKSFQKSFFILVFCMLVFCILLFCIRVFCILVFCILVFCIFVFCIFVFCILVFCILVFCIHLFNSVSNVFLLLCLYILIDMYALLCIFVANWHSPATLTEVSPCFFLSFNTNAKVYYVPRKDGARSALFLIRKLCCSMYCLCVNVYCTTATGCQPNCS